MRLFFEILLCSLAVFGFWCVMRLLSETLFLSRSIVPSVTLRTAEDISKLCGLLQEARATLSCRRGSTLVVLLDEGLTDRGEVPRSVQALCHRHGAVCYVVQASEDR